MNTLRQLAARIARQCAVSVACTFNAVCAMQRCCPPPPRRKFEIKFALRRIGILAGFAVCILTFAAPDAQAQALLGENCAAAGWDYEGQYAKSCAIASTFPGAQTPNGGCTSDDSPEWATRNTPHCKDIFGSDYSFPTSPGDGTFPAYIYNCDSDGSKGLIPATVNTIGALECTCADATQGIRNGVCVTCPDEEGVLADGTCGVCPEIIENGICVACPFAGQVVVGNACVCPDNHTPFGGICIPDSPRDFGELSDAVLCGAFGGEVLQESLPQEAGELISQVNLLAQSSTRPAVELAVYVAMTNAIQAKFRGDSGAVNAFLSRYDTGGDDYNADAYDKIVVRANRAYFGSSAGTFSSTKSNELARILARVPVKDPGKCIGANNSDALCVLDDEADSAGVLPCQGQFQRLWTCRNTGWSFSVNNGGSCGVLLTLAGGAVSDKCHLSGSVSPQCDDVFGAEVDFPAPTLSTDGATLRFVYNCDPNGNKKLIPATTNTIAATECTCTAGEEMYGGACVPVCAETEIRAGGVCVASAVLDKCEGAGWDFSTSENSCGILLTLAGGAASDKCYLSGSTSPKCADVFASTAHYFPSPTLAADGATLRFVYNCDPDGESGLIPATANTIAATECGCESGASVFSDVCISDDGDLGLSDELLCGAFGGTVRTATGGKEVCSGMDVNDTFCIMDSAVGFPCRGLFKHLRSCNLQFNRKALNPFFCGEKCGAQKAVGSECR